MDSTPSALPGELDTIAELRELFRASEARAARLRLLSATGRDLADADGTTLDPALARCAKRLAFFVGAKAASVGRDPLDDAIAVHPPGGRSDPVAWLRLPDLPTLGSIADPEDREAVRLTLELMGAAIDRIDREDERATLLATLQERERRLEAMVGQMFGAQEEERRRVSQELHDGVAQTATALARMIEGSGGRPGQDLPATDRHRIADIARGLVSEIRAVIGGLRPTLLDDLGLVAAVHALADGLDAEGYAVRVDLPPPGGERFPLSVETALFRVAQEAITNVRKHSGGPCSVTVRLGAPHDGDGLELRVEDEGVGLPVEAPGALRATPGRQVGIDIMRERMTAVGGTLEWGPGAHGGVAVVARVDCTGRP